MRGNVSFFEILSRCLRSRCPVCGQGRLFAGLTGATTFTHVFLPVAECGSCRFRYARQPGYYLGVVTPILPCLALMTGMFFGAIAYFGFHSELEALIAWSAAGVGLGFFSLFRAAVAIYIALDHVIDPPKTGGGVQ